MSSRHMRTAGLIVVIIVLLALPTADTWWHHRHGQPGTPQPPQPPAGSVGPYVEMGADSGKGSGPRVANTAPDDQMHPSSANSANDSLLNEDGQVPTTTTPPAIGEPTAPSPALPEPSANSQSGNSAPDDYYTGGTGAFGPMRMAAFRAIGPVGGSYNPPLGSLLGSSGGSGTTGGDAGAPGGGASGGTGIPFMPGDTYNNGGGGSNGGGTTGSDLPPIATVPTDTPGNNQNPTNQVPEPGAVAMLIGALVPGTLLVRGRRRR